MRQRTGPSRSFSLFVEEFQPAASFREDERVDVASRERFGAFHEELTQIRAGAELTTPVRVRPLRWIALERFPRNMYRGTARRRFRRTPLAFSISRHASDALPDLSHSCTAEQRPSFLYMAFQRSEDHAVQARSLELFAQLGDHDNIGCAQRHKEIIDRFGRFPRRNEALRRG